MNHRLERLLSCYLDEEVTLQERAEVERLLRTDPEARAFLEELRWVRGVLRALPGRPLPEEITAGILRVVRGQETARGGPDGSGTLRRLFAGAQTRIVVAAASLVAVVVLGAVPLLRMERDTSQDAGRVVDLFVWEHTRESSANPLVDRAYVGITLTDANLSLTGERPPEEDR
ncbi:MAG: hypothetical protein N0A24_11820 [Armatimonadetes bacterium]|nr:hypothetical protein [Armatimonadota bacterium]MDW8154858.1 hypothetical protein [Armatimonadota bacterium]